MKFPILHLSRSICLQMAVSLLVMGHCSNNGSQPAEDNGEDEIEIGSGGGEETGEPTAISSDGGEEFVSDDSTQIGSIEGFVLTFTFSSTGETVISSQEALDTFASQVNATCDGTSVPITVSSVNTMSLRIDSNSFYWPLGADCTITIPADTVVGQDGSVLGTGATYLYSPVCSATDSFDNPITTDLTTASCNGDQINNVSGPCWETCIVDGTSNPDFAIENGRLTTDFGTKTVVMERTGLQIRKPLVLPQEDFDVVVRLDAYSCDAGDENIGFNMQWNAGLGGSPEQDILMGHTITTACTCSTFSGAGGMANTWNCTFPSDLGDEPLYLRMKLEDSTLRLSQHTGLLDDANVGDESQYTVLATETVNTEALATALSSNIVLYFYDLTTAVGGASPGSAQIGEVIFLEGSIVGQR